MSMSGKIKRNKNKHHAPVQGLPQQKDLFDCTDNIDESQYLAPIDQRKFTGFFSWKWRTYQYYSDLLSC